ncbi:MAG: hypothetical protein NT016_03710 [Candidatus Aenigmarchaeota archaeon]|nr:hypothetical protein [Candidatus Aenigmarchaeota archaeon]
MGEDGKSFLDGLKPTWRDALYAALGIGVGIKAPGYLRAREEENARRQAKFIAEEVQKQLGLYKKAEG